MAAAADGPQVFPNVAKDSKESPYIQKLVATTTATDLVLRFEPNPDVGRKNDVLQIANNQKCHHANTQLIVTLNNEAMEELSISVGLDDAGKLKVFPSDAATMAIDDKGINVNIPLKKVQFTPVFAIAETLSLFYTAENVMVAGEGRNLFATKDGPAKITVAGLPVKPDKPEIKDLKVTETTSASATVEWTTNNRTDATVQLSTAGQSAQNINQDFRTRRHKLMLTDLQPATEYQAVVSGTDFAGRSAAPVTVKFRTETAKPMKGKSNAWLRVKGRYIVDAAGKPYPLGAYSQFPGEFWWNEFPRYGTMALTARYYRNLGLNACRLGLCNYMPGHWSAGISREEDLFKKWGGMEGFVKNFLRPIANQIMDEGMYLIIDWHWTYGMTPEYIEQIAQFWEACAKEFKDEPRVAMYQLLNEPCFKDGANRPDLAPRIRDITKDMIQRIRKHDKRHILLVSDWNCGWGWATESQWAPVNFDPGDPEKQIVYSKHISKEHCTDAFMIGGVDRIADKYDVPIFFDEVESSGLMSGKDHLWFYQFLAKNPRKYGYATWVAGQYWSDFASVTAAFAQSYFARPGFAEDTHPVVKWWRITEPAVTKSANETRFTYTMPQRMAQGDYGILIDDQENTRRCQLALKVRKDSPKLIGAWLGAPNEARWLDCPQRTYGESAIPNATFFPAIESFDQIVLKTDATFKTPPGIQIFRLNPRHQMPLPTVPRREVN